MSNPTLTCVVTVALLNLSANLGLSLIAAPVDPNLTLGITRSNQNVVLTWPGSNAVPYQVESGFDFTWTNASLVITGTGGPLFFTNPINASGRSFYRVKKFVTISAVFNPATGVLTVIGNELDNSITISRDGVGTIYVNNGTVPVTGGVATVANTVLIEVFGRAGNDQLTMDQSGGVLPSAHLFGEEGDDTLTGSSAVDQIAGGPGSDTLIGRGGNDLLGGGADSDTYIWNPGDGSDTIEGGTGTDVLVFNGSAANEKFDLAANGTQLRLTRDVGNIVIDADRVQQVTLNAFGGVDTVTINNLGATAVNLVNVDLAGPGGIDDAQTDAVILPGTASFETFGFAANAGAVEASGFGALVRVFDSAGAADLINVLGTGNDVVTVNGSAGADTMVVTASGTNAVVTATGFPVPVYVSGASGLVINGLGGDDTISCIGNLAAVVPLTLDGGDGNDLISGGNGGDTIIGGNGNDILDGNQGNDTVFGGADNDTFVWDPGDGSDTLEGQTGTNSLVFNGSNANENIELSPNGGRLRLIRDIGSILMDINDVQYVTVNALGGIDRITVNGLAGTGVSLVNVNLAATGGSDDGQQDLVVLPGTAGQDAFSFTANAGTTEASGFGALVRVFDAPTNTDYISITGAGNDVVTVNGSSGDDTMTVVANGTVALAGTTGFPILVGVSGAATLVMKGLGGQDNISCVGNLAAIVPLVLDGGEGDDTINGSNGADLILGGDGNDFLDGNQGNDTVFGGADNDTFRWDPGDGSDILEGQSGTNMLVFNGSAASEIIELAADGSRLRLTRNIGAIVMDVDGVQRVDLNALAGTDSIIVNSLAATAVTQVNLDLAGSIGGASGDAAVDAITMNGTAAADAFNLTANAGAVDVSGIVPLVHIAHPEVANDSLTINGQAGADTFSIGGGVTSLISVVTNQ